MNLKVLEFEGEQYIVLPKNMYNSLVSMTKGMKKIIEGDTQVSLEEQATKILQEEEGIV